MDQACGVHTWVRQHPPVPQSALGDLWGDRVEHPGHRRAPDRPHREGLRQRQLLWQISATAVWWALVYRWKHVNIQSAGSFSFFLIAFVSFIRCCQGWSRPPPTSISCCQLDLSSAHSSLFWFIPGLLLQRVQPRGRGAGFGRRRTIGRPLHPAAVDAKGWRQHPACDHSDQRKPQGGGDYRVQHCQKWCVIYRTAVP